MREIDLEEVRHLAQPALLHEPDMIRVLVVVLVSVLIRELHRDPKAVVVFRADLGQELKCLDAWNDLEPFCCFEKCTFFVRPCRMGERERDGVSDAMWIHARRLAFECARVAREERRRSALFAASQVLPYSLREAPGGIGPPGDRRARP